MTCQLQPERGVGVRGWGAQEVSDDASISDVTGCCRRRDRGRLGAGRPHCGAGPETGDAASGAAAAAPAKPAAKAWTAPRTPWGDPDLQGIWNFATSTPLERPADVGEKPVLSDAEAEEFEEKLAFDLTRDRRDGGNEADVRRAYNEHWMDPRRLQLSPTSARR